MSEPVPRVFERQILPRFIVAVSGAFASLFGYGLIEAAADRGLLGASYVDAGNDWTGPGIIVGFGLALTLLITGALKIGMQKRRLSIKDVCRAIARITSMSTKRSLFALVILQLAIVVVLELCESHGLVAIKSPFCVLGGPLLLVLGVQAVLARFTLIGVRRASERLARVEQTLRYFIGEFFVLISDIRAVPARPASLTFTRRVALRTPPFVRPHGLRAPPILAA